MQIHQVLVSARPGDAITNSALELRSLLRNVCASEIYARHVDPALDDVLPLRTFARRVSPRPRDDIILFHASIGEPEVFSFIMDRPERMVLLYHNISPAEPFLPWDPAFAGLLENGRRELAALRDRATLALADSAYNAGELEALGYANVRVSPLVVDIDALHEIDSHWGTANHLENNVDGPLVLFVGQVLPHKRPDLLLKSFHVLSTYLVPEAHLVVLGNARLRRYRAALENFVRELNLAKVWITGTVSDEELVAFYRRADVFVTASEHEGFCVPLLEAMAFDVPIVAREHAAVPETLAGSGLLLPPDDDPVLMAEAVATVVHDTRLREALVERGRRRLADFDPDVARARFIENLSAVL